MIIKLQTIIQKVANEAIFRFQKVKKRKSFLVLKGYLLAPLIILSFFCLSHLFHTFTGEIDQSNLLTLQILAYQIQTL